MGLYYEDYTIGQEFITGRRTITEADIMNFGALTWDNNPLHTDQVFGETTIFGQRIGHGLIGLSYAIGLNSLLGLDKDVTMAFLEVDQWKFLGPILIGDTIHVKTKTIEKTFLFFLLLKLITLAHLFLILPYCDMILSVILEISFLDKCSICTVNAIL